MKRFFRALALWLFVLVIAHGVNAQGKHEISAGAGVGSERALATRGIWKSRLDGTGSTTVRSSGVYHLGYRFLNKKQIALGLSATAESMDVIRTGAPMPDFWGSTAESKDTHIALLLDCRYQWGGAVEYKLVFGGSARYRLV